MVIGEAVAEGLAAMPPGPALAAVLGGLDLGSVPNDDILDVLVAQSRQLAHDQARVWAAMNEVIHRRPFAGPLEVRRAAVPEQYGADEVRAALAWSRRAAERETDLAFVVVCRLPLVQEALLAGRIDRSKAAVFAQHLADLSAAQIAAVCAALLPVAGRLTPGQLAGRVLRLVLELDPGYYERRYRTAVRDRMFFGYLDPDGTATITAKGLPADQAAAALERVDLLARAARRAGHPGTLDQLRADIALGLLDGTLHHLSRDQIIDALRTRHAGGIDPDTDPSGRGHDATATATATAGPPPESTPAESTPPESTPPESTPPDSTATGDTTAGGSRGVAPDQRAGVEIRVPLSTLLGLDHRAGEIPGLGPVTASAARRTVARQRQGMWRWVVLDPIGRLLSEGITRVRPGHLPRSGPRGGLVELQIPEADLDTLAADPAAHGPWATVITDIAAQHRRNRADPDAAAREMNAHPGDRFPRARLRRHVQVRDRTCAHPGCRAPARRAQQDHTRDHARGGPTTTDDLSPLCDHDHTLKTDGHWTLYQPRPGRFVWFSPLKGVYPVTPEPILPPAPQPVTRQPEPWFDEPAGDNDQPLTLSRRGRAPPARPPTVGEPAEEGGEEPPF